jgi:hypothetical protein
MSVKLSHTEGVPESEEAAAGWIKLHNDELHDFILM